MRLRRRRLGFTMVELLTVITIVGILAVAAAPSFVRLLRDRRVTDAAQQLADLYRGARSRAMGRGSAILIRWNQNASTPTNANPAGRATMREAIMGAGQGALLPSTSCFATDWTATSVTSRYVMSFDDRRPRFDPAAAAFQDAQGTAVNYAEICFTPRGRTFIRYAPNGVFTPLIGVPRIEVRNTKSNMRRYVIVPPNGVARVIKRI